jgi:polysaccharide biosynthesis transport protein
MEINKNQDNESFDTIDLKHLFGLLRRNVWFILIVFLLATAAALAFSISQTPVYSASTQVMVVQSSSQGTSVDVTQSLDVWTLAQTYLELLSHSWITDRVEAHLHDGQSIGLVTISLSSDYAPILYIEVEDPDPSRAALIADTLVQVLIEQNESIQSTRYTNAEKNLDLQIKQMEDQLAQTQSSLELAKKNAFTVQLTEAKNSIQNTRVMIDNTQAELARLNSIGSTEQAQFLLADAQFRLNELQTQLSEATAEQQQLQSDPNAGTRLAELESLINSINGQINQLTQDVAYLTPFAEPGVLGRTIREKQEFQALQETLLLTYQETLKNLESTGKITADTNEITSLENNLNLYRQIYLGLIDNRETIRLNRIQNMPNVVQANPAIATQSPIRPRTMINTLMGGMAGLIIALSIVLLRDFLDTTIKSREDVEKAVGLPVLGYSLPLAANKDGDDGPFVLNSPRAPAAEAFRSLRTNLEFIGVDKPIKSLLISSSEAGEGKTITAANLAVIMAQGGRKVVIVDADLRRPRLHQEMGIPNRIGLSDIFRGKMDLENALQPYRDLSLSVITSGAIPPNPAELLGSEKMKHILDELVSRFDIVLIDSSPTLVTDSQLIAARVDGVLLVVRAGESQAEAARATVEQYRRVNARLLGVVLNNVVAGGQYGYANYYYYHHDDDESFTRKGKLKLPSFRLPWKRKNIKTIDP